MDNGVTQLDRMIRGVQAGGAPPDDAELRAAVLACLQAASRADSVPYAGDRACCVLNDGVRSRQLGGAVMDAIDASPRGYFQLAAALRLDEAAAAAAAALRPRVEAWRYTGMRLTTSSRNWQQVDWNNGILDRARAAANAAILLGNILARCSRRPHVTEAISTACLANLVGCIQPEVTIDR